MVPATNMENKVQYVNYVQSK